MLRIPFPRLDVRLSCLVLLAGGAMLRHAAGNDAMAMAADQALHAAGKADKIKVFGFDSADDGVRAIAEGKIAATMMQFPQTTACSSSTSPRSGSK